RRRALGAADGAGDFLSALFELQDGGDDAVLGVERRVPRAECVGRRGGGGLRERRGGNDEAGDEDERFHGSHCWTSSSIPPNIPANKLYSAAPIAPKMIPSTP